MDNLVMQDARAKFAAARELCPGMSEEIYALTDYIATVINEGGLDVFGFPVIMIGIMDDLEKKKCGFRPSEAIEFPEYLAEHNLQARAQLPYILQVIDAMADEDYAYAVREECRECFEWEIPKLINTIAEGEGQPAYIKAAVDWWVDVIQHPKMDNGTDELASFMAMFGGATNRRQLTSTELRTFHEALTEVLNERFAAGDCDVKLQVDYGPDGFLAKAGDKIGLGLLDYPCKTTMWISSTEVSVAYGYGAPPPDTLEGYFGRKFHFAAKVMG